MKLTNSPDGPADSDGEAPDRTVARAARSIPAEPIVRAAAPLAVPLTRMAAEYYLHRRRSEVAVREAETRSETLQHLSDAELRASPDRSHGRTAPPETPTGPQSQVQDLLEGELCQTCRMVLQHARDLPPDRQQDVLEAFESYKETEQAYESGNAPKADMEEATDRLLDAAGL